MKGRKTRYTLMMMLMVMAISISLIFTGFSKPVTAEATIISERELEEICEKFTESTEVYNGSGDIKNYENYIDNTFEPMHKKFDAPTLEDNWILN